MIIYAISKVFADRKKDKTDEHGKRNE
jgi:hypothetical protein